MTNLTQFDIPLKHKTTLTPEEIDKNLSKLPNIFMCEVRSSLPPVRGIYIITEIDYYPILYIGQSSNLRNRVLNHNKRRKWREISEYGIDNLRVVWIEIIEISDLCSLSSFEKALIEYFDPPLNTTDRLGRHKMIERDNYLQKIDSNLLATSLRKPPCLYCNGFPIAWLYTNKLSEVQIKKILNSYITIDWRALQSC